MKLNVNLKYMNGWQIQQWRGALMARSKEHRVLKNQER
jgi:hypothetical protein